MQRRGDLWKLRETSGKDKKPDGKEGHLLKTTEGFPAGFAKVSMRLKNFRRDSDNFPNGKVIPFTSTRP